MKNALVVYAHPFPQRSRANRLILDELKSLHGVTISDLYEKYPYFYIDVAAEKELLLKHEIVLFQSPFYWYSVPPLMKLWFDNVLEPGGQTLKGKDFILSITMSEPLEYTRWEPNSFFEVEYFLPAYMQVSRDCQMRWGDPFILKASDKAEKEQILAHASAIKNRLLEMSGGGLELGESP